MTDSDTGTDDRPERAAVIAEATMARVRDAVGLLPAAE